VRVQLAQFSVAFFTIPLCLVWCSRTKRYLNNVGATGRLDGLTISSAGLDTEAAVIVYRGEVTGATLLTASRGIYVSDTI
jgi:hypothetical protein